MAHVAPVRTNGHGAVSPPPYLVQSADVPLIPFLFSLPLTYRTWRRRTGGDQKGDRTSECRIFTLCVSSLFLFSHTKHHIPDLSWVSTVWKFRADNVPPSTAGRSSRSRKLLATRQTLHPDPSVTPFLKALKTKIWLLTR